MTPLGVGLIGCGHIGRPIAHRVMRSGHPLVVCDVRPEAYTDLVMSGAQVGTTPADVAARADIILLSLYDSDIVEQVVFGAHGIASVDATGKIVVDLSTGLPERSRQFAARFAERGGAMLDSPLTGGVTGASAGTLSFMVGGDQAAFGRALPILQAMGRDIIHLGPAGSGMVVKMANQMLITTFFTAIVEAFDFVDRHGIDLTDCFRAIVHGSGQSRRLDKFGAQYLLHDLDQDATEVAHYKAVFDKDLAYALEQAERQGIPMPFAQLSMRLRRVLPVGDDVEALLTAWRGVSTGSPER